MAKKYPGVTPLGEGRYRIRTEMRHPKTGAAHEINRITEAESAAAAARVLASERAAWLLKHAGDEPSGPRRLGESLDAWLGQKRGSIKPSTAATYQSAVAWWKDVLGEYWLVAPAPRYRPLGPRDVREALAGAREGGDATDTVNGRLRVLRTFAKETGHGRIVENVAALERSVHEDEADEDEGRGLEVAELRRFLEHGPAAWKTPATGRVHSRWPRAWALVATMAWSGLRFGEASALEWRDVDLDEGTLRVRRAQWRGIVGHPKARASKRVVVIPPELVELLREHRATMLREQARGVESALVFPSPRYGNATAAQHGRGRVEHVTNGYVRKSVEKVCRAARISLGERPAVHCLRHTWNNLVRQHGSELVRQALIGHADEEIGARYSKVSADEKRETVLRVVRAVKGGE